MRRDGCRMQVLEANIATVEIDEVVLGFGTMYAVGGAIETTAEWRRLLHTFVDQMTVR